MFLLPLLLLLSCLLPSAQSQCTGYDCVKEYVEKDDGAYTWTDTGHRLNVPADSNGRGGWTGYFLNFTSQQWLSSEQVSRPEWWHIMVVIVPEILLTKDTTILWLTDGDNKDDFQPDLTDYNLLVVGEIAATNHIVTSAVFQVPNQPIVYTADPLQSHRSEDDNLAFTWWHFFNDPSHDPEYLLWLPMAKTGVKAMDTVENFLTSDTAPEEVQALGLTPTQHIVSGASKRGWTTWIVGAVDPRVMAIMPVVFDSLNFMDNIMHHFRSYGGWSFAFEPYWKLNLTMYFKDPKIQDMFDIVDPYSYKEKLVLPKLVCNAGGDEFFLPDNIRYWWKDMPMHEEMNRFLTLPNGEHATATAILELLPAANTWLREILQASATLGHRPAPASIEERELVSIQLMAAAQVPAFNWTISPSGEEITVTSDRAPVKATMWHASTCFAHKGIRKDFRLVNDDKPCTCGLEALGHCVNLAVTWAPTDLQETSPGSLTWVGHMPAPTGGQWTAFMVDLQFDGPKSPTGWPTGEDGFFEFTSAISIVPDTFPYEACNTPEECLGHIV